jgi:L-iditol 2-dehydrogenase
MELIPPPYVAAEPPPRTLVIFGAGPIGLTHLKLARARGIEAVTVVEPTASRREIARQFGAVETCSPEEFQANGRFEAAICAVGVAELVDLAMKSVTKRGKVNLFAGFDKTAVSTIDPNIIHYQQLRITGASESRRRDYAEAIDLVLTGSIDPAPLITHRFRLDAYKEAFELAESGSALKILFEMSGPGD